MRESGSGRVRARRIALIGNPNSGKTTVFNSLTGLRQKVGNYPGVTVEKKEGRLTLPDGSQASILDLPGTYSLTANSPDERIATDVLLGLADHTEQPDLVICVVDASNLERSLYLVSQIIDRQLPVIVALNMMDVANTEGTIIHVHLLEKEFGIRAIPMTASRGEGIQELKQAITAAAEPSHKSFQWRLPEPFQKECEELSRMLQVHQHLNATSAFQEAMDLLASPTPPLRPTDRYSPELIQHVMKDHAKLDFLGIDRGSVAVESRYVWIRSVCTGAVDRAFNKEMSTSDRIDRVLTHRVWGLVVFAGLMAFMFQMIFSWAAYPMEWIRYLFDGAGREMMNRMPPGDLRNLLVHGGLAGVGAIVTFLPQILFLFLFLGLLEDTGYMSRAAFIMDRLMRKVGLHGKSFIPLLSSFACAIPGIMATRTIGNPRDRIATMMVAPLMSCSARLPVHALLIAAFIPNTFLFGIVSLPALTLLSMYFLGLVAALFMAWVFKKSLLKAPPPVFIMELPPYRVPSLRSILLQMWERAGVFLKKAGTIILGASIVLWFLANYPKIDHASPSEQLQHSFAGRAGHLIAPVISPLGFDWKIGIGLISSLLQREVFVSTMGTIYNIENSETSDWSLSLRQQMQKDRDPLTGMPTFTVLTAICIMVYYVLSMQCLSTVAIMYRETNGWKWPFIQIGYMTALAYGVTFTVFRAGVFLGMGG